MAFTGTSLLSLPIITTGTESGAWGNITNNGLTQYLDTAIAGALSITSSITLANTSGDATGTNLTSTTAQYRTLVVPASGPSANIVITAPSSNRTYHVINRNATYTVQIRAGANSGVTLAANQSATVSYDSVAGDYVLVGPNVFSANKITLSGTNNTTMTLPSTDATIARTDAGQTFTGTQVMTSPRIVTSINDTNGNEVFDITATASAVNQMTVTNAATGNSPKLSASGNDTNVALTLAGKGTGDVVAQVNSTNVFSVSSTFGFKNRIINGAMMIDQRNAGASITPTDGQYSVDRWVAYLSQSSKFTVQQNAGAVTPPTGYINYLGFTSSSAYAVLTGDYFGIRQSIEGLNVADLAWGTASAATVTLSFWVRSSLTGTFGGALQNSGNTRSYPFTYTISSANTWEQKSVTIPGDTTGTWLTTNGAGISVRFTLGAGATYSGTAGSWAAANYLSATGATSVVGTNGATFYITGVQLEKGSTATSFDYRPYGTELMLCQRYFESSNGAGGAASSTDGFVVDTNNDYKAFPFKVGKRASPTMGALLIAGGTGATIGGSSQASFYIGSANSTPSTFGWTASSEL